MRRIVNLCVLLCVPLLLWNAGARAQQTPSLSVLEFHSSHAALNGIFRWATQQALAYVHSGSDSIGPWYEAALPGRNSFCIHSAWLEMARETTIEIKEPAGHKTMSQAARY